MRKQEKKREEEEEAATLRTDDTTIHNMPIHDITLQSRVITSRCPLHPWLDPAGICVRLKTPNLDLNQSGVHSHFVLSFMSKAIAA